MNFFKSWNTKLLSQLAVLIGIVIVVLIAHAADSISEWSKRESFSMVPTVVTFTATTIMCGSATSFDGVLFVTLATSAVYIIFIFLFEKFDGVWSSVEWH